MIHAATAKIAPSAHHAPPLYVVFNAASGSGDGERNQRLVRDILQAARREHAIFLVREPKRLTHYAAHAARLARERGGAVVVAGGDGTINTVAQAALDNGCLFGIIPQGTFNYTGRSQGIPLDTAGATRALLDAATPTRMQVGLVNGRAFLVNASLGLYPQLLQDREAHKKQFGRYRVVAFASAVSTMLHGNGLLSLELVLDGQREVVQTPSLFVGNNALQFEQTGLPEAEVIGNQRLAGVVLRAAGPSALLGLLVRGLAGRLGGTAALRHFAFGELRVVPALRGVRKLKVALDGEVFWMKPPLVFSVSEQPLWLLGPQTPAGEAP